MLLLILHQLAVCVSLLALVVLSVNCVDLLRGFQPREVKLQPTFQVMAVLWITNLFRTLYEGFYLVERTTFGACIAGCGLGLLIPVFYGYFKKNALIKKELVFVLCLYLISIINIGFFTCYVFDILYSLCVLIIGVYIAMRSASIQRMRRWIDRYFMLWVASVSSSAVKTVQNLRSIWLEPEKVKRINDILAADKYTSDKITLDKLARSVGINRSYISRYFNEQKGVSYRQYVKEVRFKRVEAALRETNKTVTEAYDGAGFASCTFYTSFKNTHQMTPEEWRDMKQKAVLGVEENDS